MYQNLIFRLFTGLSKYPLFSENRIFLKFLNASFDESVKRPNFKKRF
jgi:hypothetical protein